MTKFSQNVYRLTLEYDGTRYHGWQEQPNARTVAGEVRAPMKTSNSPAPGAPMRAYTRLRKSRTFTRKPN
jgi:tRNA U38,U39,U40 pseudouridine synthase TruA